jgi:polysaccharide biosynthesis/export protein
VRYIPVIFAFLLGITSCQVLNPERMLRTPPDFEYSAFDETTIQPEYRLAPNDKLYFRLFTNDGERLVDPINPMVQQIRDDQQVYTIEFDGLVKIPILGRVTLGGLTVREAERYLENQFASYYNRPFVQLRVTNNRVIVFPGGRGGTSSVVYLENSNTTLFEALALAGGIADGKAHRVKLIRGDLADPQVFLIDLSTIEGVKNADMIVQANDVIYVEPRERVPQRIMENISPYLTLLSAALIVYSLFR